MTPRDATPDRNLANNHGLSLYPYRILIILSANYVMSIIKPNPNRLGKIRVMGNCVFVPSEMNCWAILILSPLLDTMLLSSLAPVLII
jgi:hypothetical protein